MIRFLVWIPLFECLVIFSGETAEIEGVTKTIMFSHYVLDNVEDSAIHST